MLSDDQAFFNEVPTIIQQTQASTLEPAALEGTPELSPWRVPERAKAELALSRAKSAKAREARRILSPTADNSIKSNERSY